MLVFSCESKSLGYGGIISNGRKFVSVEGRVGRNEIISFL